jgi:hypothetical protein
LTASGSEAAAARWNESYGETTGMWCPELRSFQRPMVIPTGTSPTTNSAAGRTRRASKRASAGPPRKSAAEGLIPIAAPAARPDARAWTVCGASSWMIRRQK